MVTISLVIRVQHRQRDNVMENMKEIKRVEERETIQHHLEREKKMYVKNC